MSLPPCHLFSLRPLLHIFSPNQFHNLICFLDAYNSRLRNRLPSIKATPIKQQQHQQQQHQPPPETPGRFTAALDDIAKKLQNATNKLGRPLTSSLPVPMESNDQDVDFLTVNQVCGWEEADVLIIANSFFV